MTDDQNIEKVKVPAPRNPEKKRAGSHYEFFATTAKGMEKLLVEELQGLGVEKPQESRAGVVFSGSMELAYRACLWSRIANRILMPLKTFPAAHPDQLYGGVRAIHWTDHLTVDHTLAVDFSTSHSKIQHSHYGALKVKDAIVDQFRTLKGSRPSIDPVQPDLRINVYLLKIGRASCRERVSSPV